MEQMKAPRSFCKANRTARAERANSEIPPFHMGKTCVESTDVAECLTRHRKIVRNCPHPLKRNSARLQEFLQLRVPPSVSRVSPLFRVQEQFLIGHSALHGIE